MVAWLRTGHMDGGAALTIEALAEACAALANATDTEHVCVTRGSIGAVFWERGKAPADLAPMWLPIMVLLRCFLRRSSRNSRQRERQVPAGTLADSQFAHRTNTGSTPSEGTGIDQSLRAA